MLDHFLPRPSDTWIWECATISDVEDITDMVRGHFKQEVDAVFKTDEPLFKKNLCVGIFDQAYNPLSQQIIVARNKTTNQLMAWAWIVRGVYTVYSADEIADARFAHCDLDLSQRVRVTLMAQILQQWELWCRCGMIPIISSSTVRQDQGTFLKLHKQAGYSVRGSITYKRLM
jgi:hypothetical protein